MEQTTATIDRLTVDSDTGMVSVHLSNGHVVAKDFSLGPMPWAELFSVVTVDVASESLELRTLAGKDLVVELPRRGVDPVVRRAGRPTVYLDQNHWITLMAAEQQADRLTPAVRAAALELISLARARKVILLLSSGHMLETGKAAGPWRQTVAPLMVELSRGWILRDPLQVRHQEFAALFARRTGTLVHTQPVVTLDPTALMGTQAYNWQAPAGVTELEVTRLLREVNEAMSIWSILIEDTPEDGPEGRWATEQWRQRNAELSRLSSQHRSSEAALRGFTLQAFLADHGPDMASAASASHVPPAVFGEWVRDCESDLATAPFLGRYRELMHARLRNPQEKWEANDLIDGLYLTCAAAYTDVVVAEKHTGHLLRRIQEARPDGAKIVTNLAEGVGALNL